MHSFSMRHKQIQPINSKMLAWLKVTQPVFVEIRNELQVMTESSFYQMTMSMEVYGIHHGDTFSLARPL
jgi:hypothetical protein